METEREKVAKGARLMDKILPGWHNQVDLDKLDMSSGSMCLLGQTFGVHKEQCLAKEMYPEEYARAVAATSAGGTDFGGTHKAFGYRIAGDGRYAKLLPWGGMVGTLATKLGVGTADELDALHHVCKGHNIKCEWAEEIAARRAVEGSKE